MPDKYFLENYPLYRKFEFKLPEQADSLKKITINMKCPNCKSKQTFIVSDIYYEGCYSTSKISLNQIVKIKYECVGCKKGNYEFLVRLSENHIQKVGQYPPWSINPEKNIEKALGEYLDIYKNGLICESQGYGIGAYAYYRRIVEDIIDTLLDDIKDLVDENNIEEYNELLERTKKSNNATDKIEIVKDHLPSILKPNGQNPLKFLYSILSEGIHSSSDKDCLEIAVNVRNILTFLVDQIINSKNTSKEFTDSMKELLDKKNKNS